MLEITVNHALVNPIMMDILSIFPGLGGAFSLGRNNRELCANHICTKRYCWYRLVLYRKPQQLNQKMQPWPGLWSFLEGHWVWMRGPDPWPAEVFPSPGQWQLLRGPLPRITNRSVFNQTILSHQVPFQLEISTSLSSNIHRTAKCSSLRPRHCGGYVVSSSHSSCSQERICLRSQWKKKREDNILIPLPSSVKALQANCFSR